ncbi:MAG TPA: methyltransferase domain-containing protein [Terriglobales bacterium]|nr:methyltransferase domain-containing protein [Terriglobales bacterium]
MVELSYPARTAYQSKQAAETYDRLRFQSLKGKWLDAKEKKLIGELLGFLPPGSRILDLACGTGRISEYLLVKGYEVWGVDISQEMLDFATKKLSCFEDLVKFHKVDAENLPFEEKSFDSASCIRLMGHIPPVTRSKILQELKRVTRGPFVVAYYLSEPVANTKRRIKKFLKGDKSPWFPISLSNLKQEINSAGLRIIEQKRVQRFFSETIILLLN